MNDDEMMDDVLRAAMSSPPPQPSPMFVHEIQRRTAPRRLTPTGRRVMAVYAVAGAAFCLWMLRDLPLGVSVVTLAVQSGVAIALRGYTNYLAGVARR